MDAIVHVAKSPDLNVTEEAINMHRDFMFQIQEEDGHCPDKATLRARMERAIVMLDADKEWFKKVFSPESLYRRYQAVVDCNGEALNH